MRILLAMSGGVDSSTLAHMLVEQGHEVIGVRFTLWSDPLAPALAQILPKKCCNTETSSRAREVCRALGIALHVIDLSEEFKKNVVDPFLNDHRAGLTPNPCIGCNRTIKFGKLLDMMDDFNCDRLATGHYARVAKERCADGSERHLLLEAVDETKDQSYYLYGLHQHQLARVLFPLGGMKKHEVMHLARRYGIPLPKHYTESQDLCFFPEKTPEEFLKRHLKDSIHPGTIVRRDGSIVGRHGGLPLYTIGQRRGLGIGGLRVPLEVVEKDVPSNTLIVATKGAESVDEVEIVNTSWISWKPEERRRTAMECRTRSLSRKHTGTVFVEGNKTIWKPNSPLPPQAKGQSLVFSRGEEVLGGGVIA